MPLLRTTVPCAQCIYVRSHRATFYRVPHPSWQTWQGPVRKSWASYEAPVYRRTNASIVYVCRQLK